MTTEPYAYTDPSGDLLHVGTCREGLHLVAEIIADEDAPSFRAPVCIPSADVRKVTAVMHEKAGLPDRWTELRDDLARRLDLCETMARTHGDAEARNLAAERCSVYRTTLRRMDEMEAGQ